MQKKAKMLSAIFMAFLFILMIQLTASAMPSSWGLVWSDEFSGPVIDTSRWVFDIGNGNGGWNNNEREYYTDRTENARIENGVLVIEGRKEPYVGFGYTSARLKTQGRFSQAYGRIEARIKFPYGQGISSAFWMLGENSPLVGWPKCGEIDIAQLIGGGAGRDDKIHGILHWENNGYQYTMGNYQFAGKFADAYYNFAVEWNPEEIHWYVENIEYLSVKIAKGVNGTEEFQLPFYILLNLAVGGNWAGLPDASTVFPQKMYVDYIRVYGPNGANPSPTRTPVPLKPTPTPTPTRTRTPTPSK